MNKDENLNFSSEETDSGEENEAVSFEDQFSHCRPHIESQQKGEDLQTNQVVPGVGQPPKKRRAATDHVASISLSDLAKCFNLPISEASKNLNVGVTVLKRKCREFGIPRWPHRKIKSLDTLICNLQEEVIQQQKNNEAVAVKAATRRQQMLESEKEGIKRSPVMELQTETKRFRQDVFKRRHMAKALSKMSQETAPSGS